MREREEREEVREAECEREERGKMREADELRVRREGR